MCFKKTQPTARDGMSLDDMIWYLDYDKQIHEYYLTKPENLITGSWDWHKICIQVFNDCIKYVASQQNKLPYGGTIPLSELIQWLLKFQVSHAHWALYPDAQVGTADWHRSWFLVYTELIDFFERKDEWVNYPKY